MSLIKRDRENVCMYYGCDEQDSCDVDFIFPIYKTEEREGGVEEEAEFGININYDVIIF